MIPALVAYFASVVAFGVSTYRLQTCTESKRDRAALFVWLSVYALTISTIWVVES